MEDKILLGYAFRKLTMIAVDECFLSCYEDCFCMAFQVCQNSECQLLSSNRFLSSRALVSLKGCSYYDMLPDLQQVTVKMTNLHEHIREGPMTKSSQQAAFIYKIVGV